MQADFEYYLLNSFANIRVEREVQVWYDGGQYADFVIDVNTHTQRRLRYVAEVKCFILGESSVWWGKHLNNDFRKLSLVMKDNFKASTKIGFGVCLNPDIDPKGEIKKYKAS